MGWLDAPRQLRRTYYIGGNSGIYWRLPEPPEPLVKGAIDPDWFFFDREPPQENGRLKRSYVMWHEHIVPLLVLEFVLPEDREARDRTPYQGKFWIYEQALGVPYYGIHEIECGRVEFFHRVNGRYEPLAPNGRGHYEIPSLEAELGLWQGTYVNLDWCWLRWWDASGNLLLTGWERVEEQQRIQALTQRVTRMEARLRALGIDPDAD
jgi:Uma2 family endonuclease